ncbi:MAG: hypothetical protein QG620_328 [Patescibacteria group bacterium]|nr:hypothetical protein [Patescibacteria group bacterium]
MEKPGDCPFCGAKGNFIKSGKEACPIVNERIEISELSKNNLLETLELETKATAIYLCMAEKSETYEIKAMYKRLAKVESEHAAIVIKLLDIKMPETKSEECFSEDLDNFKKTIELEDRAVGLYKRFAGEAVENNIRKFFGALTQVEAGHSELIKKYI